jgi:hypothetical protein
VGVRESYIRGIEEGQWDGFRCSLTKDDIEKSNQWQKLGNIGGNS